MRPPGHARTQGRKDPHIGPFIGLPAKENGFDIEGLAVRGETVFLGLRGPVLRGWAVILRLAVRHKKKDRLELVPAEGDGGPYAKHFVHLGGLGIRDLCFDGADLLILAGPTMDLDGPVSLWRWQKPLSAMGSQVLTPAQVSALGAVPFGDGDDHAEALAWVPQGNGRALMVVYDSPARARLGQDARSVTADLFTVPRRRR